MPVTLALLLIFAQAPLFETASIRPVPPDAQCGMIQPMPGGGLRVECLSLKTILVWAWDVQDYQVSGGPGWVRADRWNIVAKPGSSESPLSGPAEYSKMTDGERSLFMELLRKRLQTLLAERFQLMLRREIREQTEYSLVVSPSGSMLKESPDGTGPFLRRGGGRIIGNAARMPQLAQYLAVDLKRPVEDQTGLTGRYDFNLAWAPDDAAPGTDPGPSLFTAIQEQLGLRLVARKGPVENLIIESVALPSEN